MNKEQNKQEWNLEQLASYLDGELAHSDAARLNDLLREDPNLARELNELKTVRTMLREIPRASLPRNFSLRRADVKLTTETEELPSWRIPFTRYQLKRSLMWVPAVLLLCAVGYLIHWFGIVMPARSTSTTMGTGSTSETLAGLVSEATEIPLELPRGRALAPVSDATQSGPSEDTSCLRQYYTGETISDEITGQVYHLYDLDGDDLCQVCPTQCVPQISEDGLATPSEIMVGTQLPETQIKKGPAHPTPHTVDALGSTLLPSITPTTEVHTPASRELQGVLPDNLIAQLDRQHLQIDGEILLLDHGQLHFQHQASHDADFVVKVTFDNPSMLLAHNWWSYGISFGYDPNGVNVFRVSSDKTWELSEHDEVMSRLIAIGDVPSLSVDEEKGNTLVLLVSDASFVAWVNGSMIGKGELPTLRIIPGQVWLTAALGTYDDHPVKESGLSIHFRDVRVWNLINPD